MTTRFALKLEYDGSAFVGWQRQDVGLSVQQVLEAAAAALAGEPVASVAAGRTDAGVHALGQVVHIDLQRQIAPARLVQALNFHMKPHRVVAVQAAIVEAPWSARFSAIRRAYRYVILNRASRPALEAQRVWHVPRALDAAAMAAGARHMLGRHDFSSFRATSCQARSPVRTLDLLDVSRHGDHLIIAAEARSFLHHQVRNMVGTLKLVGEGRWPPAQVALALAARDRSAAGPTAPAAGLFLVEVGYGDPIFA